MPSVTMFLCGDVMTGRGIDQILRHPSGNQLFEPYVRDARQYVELAEQHNGQIPRSVAGAYVWGEALAEFDRVRPDARIVNLETAVTTSDDHWPNKAVNYRMHPENIDALTAAHLDVCGLANNHVLDWGYAGLDETLDALARAGLKTAGAGRNVAEASRPAIVPLSRDGLRVVVFAVGTESAGVPPDWAARNDRAGVDLLPDFSDATADQLLARVRPARTAADLVVVGIHWGSNWGYDIPDEHVRFAHRLIDGGVDVVHGHSSHHPRAIEVYRNRLVLYGCGDFLNDYEGIAGEEAYRGDLVLMYFVTFSTPGPSLITTELVPLQIKRMQLVKPSDTDVRWVQGTMDGICRRFGSRVARTPAGTLALQWPGQSAA